MALKCSEIEHKGENCLVEQESVDRLTYFTWSPALFTDDDQCCGD